MFVVAEAVAANAAAIAVWLMSCARFGRPLVGVVVNFTVGGGLSSCVIHDDHRDYIVGWDAVRASLDGGEISRCDVPCISSMCTGRLDKIPLGRWVSRLHNGRTVGHPLKFHYVMLWVGWLAVGHPLLSCWSWWQDQCIQVSEEQF